MSKCIECRGSADSNRDGLCVECRAEELLQESGTCIECRGPATGGLCSECRAELAAIIGDTHAAVEVVATGRAEVDLSVAKIGLPEPVIQELPVATPPVDVVASDTATCVVCGQRPAFTPSGHCVDCVIAEMSEGAVAESERPEWATCSCCGRAAPLGRLCGVCDGTARRIVGYPSLPGGGADTHNPIIESCRRCSLARAMQGYSV